MKISKAGEDVAKMKHVNLDFLTSNACAQISLCSKKSSPAKNQAKGFLKMHLNNGPWLKRKEDPAPFLPN